MQNQIAVLRLKSLDTYRDGGSVSATFEESERCTTTLMLRIRMGVNDAHELTKEGYKAPMLERATKVERISPVTGKANSDWERSSEEISWDMARKLLRRLEPLVSPSDYQHVLSFMVATANADGELI